MYIHYQILNKNSKDIKQNILEVGGTVYIIVFLKMVIGKMARQKPIQK